MSASEPKAGALRFNLTLPSSRIRVVPLALTEVMREQLADEIQARRASGPMPARGTTDALVSEFAIALRPGMRKAIPLGAFGELGVEAA